ncbi:MAG: hypothetical protein LC803_13035 [Acidobacteria bacterium]|nr:hypothetical protein [Acidobacteriota bacterium]
MSKPERQRQSTSGPAREGDRKQAIERVRRTLLRGGWPRLFVSFLLALTGAAGFLISAVLLRLGVTMMTVRYPLAVILAYCVFLLLLRLWLALRRNTESDSDLLSDIGDSIPHILDPSVSAGSDAVASTFGGGADFGGAGAGGGWSSGAPGGVSADMSGGAPGGNFGGSSSVSDYVPDLPDVDLDLDDGCFWIIIPVAAIVGVVVAMFYVVYIAPVFLAEILVDALLLAGLYKRLKGVEPRHWLRSAVRRTLVPALVATALFIAAGYLMGRVAPEAHSIGEFWRQVSTGTVER